MERDAVLEWMRRRGLNNRTLAELLGISEDKVSKSLTDKGKPRQWQGREVARLIELMAEEETPLVRTEVRGTGLVSEQDVRDARWSSGNLPAVPLVGSAVGGSSVDIDEDVELTELHLGEVLDYLARPAHLAHDPNSYAVTVVGDSMAPRYEPGERAFVSPKASIAIGDDVIVQLRGDGADQLANRVTMVLIKRLARRSATFVELRQFNPEKTFRVPMARVAAIHRVSGRL